MTEMSVQSLLEVTAEAETRGSTPFAEFSGPALARVLAVSNATGDRAWLLARITGARRLKGWCEVMEQDALLALAGVAERREVHEVDGAKLVVIDEPIAEVALATGRSEGEVRAQLAAARTLANALPEVKAALGDGRVDADKALLMARTADRLPSAVHAGYSAQMLQRAAQEPLRDFKGSSEQAVRDLDPAGRDERRRRATRQRAVWIAPDIDGNAILSARLAALDAHACLRRIEDHVRDTRDRAAAGANSAGEEMPTTGMLHAQAFLNFFWGQANGSASDSLTTAQQMITDAGSEATIKRVAGGGRPLRTEVQVQVDLHTLAGLRDAAVTLDGAAVADRDALLAFLRDCDDVVFRRLITDPVDGRLLDCGRNTYSPSAALRRFIIARDGHCVWPGCQRPALHSDIDHAVPWDDGGLTNPANLHALCRHHHLLKTVAPYRLRSLNSDWQLITPGGCITPLVHRGASASSLPDHAQAPP